MPLLKLRPKQRNEVNKNLVIEVDVKAENYDEWWGFMEAEKNIPNHKPVEMSWTKKIWEVVPDGVHLQTQGDQSHSDTVHTTD